MKTPRGDSQLIDPRFSRYQLRIAPSRIQGLGVFADQTIPKGQPVIEYTGEVVNMRQAKRRINRVLRPGGSKQICLFRSSPKTAIDGSVGGCGAERINHCCHSNLTSAVIAGHIWFFSRRRIRKGVELTLDYNLSIEAGRVRCRCGSSKCRGTINRKTTLQSTKIPGHMARSTSRSR
jgi:uncharacterized protein